MESQLIDFFLHALADIGGQKQDIRAKELEEMSRKVYGDEDSADTGKQDEPAPDDVQAVLKIDPSGLIIDERDSNGDISFRCFWELSLGEKIHLDSCILTLDGELAGKLFVRRYPAGSALVVDMSRKSRELLLSRDGNTVRFQLPAHGVRLFPGWTLEFERPHLLRARFDAAGEHRLTLAKEQDLVLAVRTYAGEVELELDGKPLVPLPECKELPDGFQKLYGHVKLGHLAAGTHLLKLKNEAPEFPFLPRAVWLGEELPDYVGTVTQRAQMVIPPDAVKAVLEEVPAPGDAELWMDDLCLGVRLQQPYAWVIPEACRGKEVEVRLVRHTSVGGLFGVCWDAQDPLSRHRQKTLAPHPEPIRPLEIEFA